MYPPPLPDLGNLSSNPLTGETLKEWQPKGILVAHLHEHKGPVNQLQVSQDNMFFVSASDDGTVKIWDCQRLEKNVTNRSRLTYSSQKGKIKTLTICENTHSVAAGSDDGSIHLFRIEYQSKKDTTLNRYSGVTTVKNVEPNDGSIVGIEHFNTENASVLLYGTTKGKIHAWDLRSKNDAWLLKNPLQYGLLSSFVVAPNRNWLVVGTSSGFFTLWDLRFNIPVKSWRHPSRTRIHALNHYNSANNNPWIFATTGGNTSEVTVWDTESGTCKQLFKVAAEESSIPIQTAPYLKHSHDIHVTDYGVEELQRPIIVNTNSSDAGIKCLLNPPGCNYLITAGDDRRVRYWHLQNAASSYTICGLTKDSSKPKYSSVIQDHLNIYLEQPNGDEHGSHSSSMSKLRGPASPSVNHRESILDIKMMELPHRMLISASRDGVIKVWK